MRKVIFETKSIDERSFAESIFHEQKMVKDIQKIPDSRLFVGNI